MDADGPTSVRRQSQYRGRLAPSPTGLLHLGHAATFWLAYRRALEFSGTLILRMEDLDPARSRPEFAAAALEDLAWIGIQWQEGSDIGGPCVPYRQSERAAYYRAVWKRLLDAGAIYPCRCSRKDLAAMAGAPHESGRRGRPPDEELLYPGTCRPRQEGEWAASVPVNWRFRVPHGEVVEFTDANYGPQTFVAGEDFGDFLVWRRDGIPAYQLAVVADDDAMGITEVVRGADLLKSTARQVLLYRALSLTPPDWFHCPLIVDADGQRLAKRSDALSIRSLRALGTRPEDLLRPEFLGELGLQVETVNATQTCENAELDERKHQL